MTSYKHRQIGYLMVVVTLCVTVLYGWIYSILPPEENATVVSMVMGLVIFILISFSTLQTVVDEQHIHIKFGYGIFSKKFPLNEIVSAEIVKNRWYYGWGVRMWFWPRMSIYNVSGFDAVEVVLKSGKIYRIGTDAPEELLAAIISRLSK